MAGVRNRNLRLGDIEVNSKPLSAFSVQHKLGPSQIRRVKVLIDRGILTQAQCAQRFNVSQTTISNIALGRKTS